MRYEQGSTADNYVVNRIRDRLDAIAVSRAEQERHEAAALEIIRQVNEAKAIQRRELIDLIIIASMFGLFCLTALTGVVTWARWLFSLI